MSGRLPICSRKRFWADVLRHRFFLWLASSIPPQPESGMGSAGRRNSLARAFIWRVPPITTRKSGLRQRNGSITSATSFPRSGSHPYLIERHPLVDSRGFSCTPQLLGGPLRAVNLNTLTKIWENPLGTRVPGQQTGIRNFGGPIVTASGLVITAGAEDLWLRVFDSATGEELQKVSLPVPAVSTPMTYTLDGQQYIVVAAGGHGDGTTPLGDSLIAFAVN